MAFTFTDENLARIEESKKKYPTNLSAIMDVLWIAQEQYGYISEEVMEEIANILQIDKVYVISAATFYTMYFKKPMGKKHVQVCTNVSCMLRGAYEIWDAVREKLGIDNLEVTENGDFSLEEVECMGSCGTAPMIAINEEYFENLDKDKVLEILDAQK